MGKDGEVFLWYSQRTPTQWQGYDIAWVKPRTNERVVQFDALVECSYSFIWPYPCCPEVGSEVQSQIMLPVPCAFHLESVGFQPGRRETI
jgi:hypothetical protein